MVEFGLLALPFLATIFAIFEVGYVTFEGEMLQASINNASRQLLTGQAQLANIVTASQFVQTYLCPTGGPQKIPTNFDCSKLVVDVRPASSFTSVDLTNSIYKTATQFCPAAPNQVSVLRVVYPLPAIFPLSLLTSNVGVVTDVPSQPGPKHILMGVALFETENFAASYSPPPGC